MVRYGGNKGKTEFSYGHDHATGLFLSVNANRLLEPHEDDPDEVKKVVQKAVRDPEEGSIELHTGPGGLGQKISRDGMVLLFQRYGVSEQRIEELKAMKGWSNAEAEAHMAGLGFKYNSETGQFEHLGPLSGLINMEKPSESEGKK